MLRRDLSTGIRALRFALQTRHATITVAVSGFCTVIAAGRFGSRRYGRHNQGNVGQLFGTASEMMPQPPVG